MEWMTDDEKLALIYDTDCQAIKYWKDKIGLYQKWFPWREELFDGQYKWTDRNDHPEILAIFEKYRKLFAESQNAGCHYETDMEKVELIERLEG